MDQTEMLQEMRSDSLLNKVRREMSFSNTRIAQATSQKRPLSIADQRIMEFEAAQRIINIVQNHVEQRKVS